MRDKAYPAIDEKQVLEAAVRMKVRRQNATVGCVAAALGALQNQRARPVAEQHAGRAVGPVHQARECFGADHQNLVGLS